VNFAGFVILVERIVIAESRKFVLWNDEYINVITHSALRDEVPSDLPAI
jgi:hypothetical protein